MGATAKCAKEREISMEAGRVVGAVEVSGHR
jgi:hypothetical protein